jgi:DNA-binding protein HU-beta
LFTDASSLGVRRRSGRTIRQSHRRPSGAGSAVRIVRPERRRTPSEDASVNKNDLIDAIARHADISKAAAQRALDATVNSIKGSLKKGDVVTLVGFGSFYVGRRTARAGRNPRTGDAIRIDAAKVPKFRAGKALKDELN